MKRIEEQEEVTRGTLALRGLWVLSVYTLVLVPVLMFEKQLGITPETVQTLVRIYAMLMALELMAFGHYFARRSTR